MLGKKSRRTDAIWRDQVLWIPGKTWWWGPDRGFRANFKANDNHCTWRGQIIRISLPLVCFLRQNLQKTAEVFLTHNQICLKLACWAGWVALLAFCLSINVSSANTGYLDVSLISFLICLPWFLFSTVIFEQAQSTEQTAYLLHWILIECC